MEKQPRIVICGNYGATNLGDEAILDGILTIVQKTFPNANIAVMSSKPLETAKLHQVETIPMVPAGIRSFFASFQKKTFRLIKEHLQNADLFILGGGGLFTDEKIQAVILWFLQASYALQFKRKIFCFGQSVGPVNTRIGKYLTKKIFSKTAIITVRDSSSAKCLQNMEIQDQIHVLTDPVFALAFKHKTTVTKEKYFVFSIRSWIGKYENINHEVLAQFIDWLYKYQGYTSLLIPFEESDFKPLKNIQNQVKNQNAVKLLSYSAHYQETISAIQKAHAVIGMRLHSLIFSTITETPFLGLSYSDKVSAFMEDLEVMDYLLDWKNINVQQLQEKFYFLQKNYPQLKVHLEKKNAEQQNKIEIYGKLLREALKP